MFIDNVITFSQRFSDWLLQPDEDDAVIPLSFEVATEEADEPQSLIGAYVEIRHGWWGVVLAERNGGYSVGQLVQCGGVWFLPQRFERRFVWASEVSNVSR